jgi:hypothetical protein
MRLSAVNGDLLEIERAHSGADAYDLLLLLRVSFRGFAAETDTWVSRAAWLGFTQDLVLLEERRQGEARLESISPGELSIVIRSIDQADLETRAELPGSVRGTRSRAASCAS